MLVPVGISHEYSKSIIYSVSVYAYPVDFTFNHNLSSQCPFVNAFIPYLMLVSGPCNVNYRAWWVIELPHTRGHNHYGGQDAVVPIKYSNYLVVTSLCVLVTIKCDNVQLCLFFSFQRTSSVKLSAKLDRFSQSIINEINK